MRANIPPPVVTQAPSSISSSSSSNAITQQSTINIQRPYANSQPMSIAAPVQTVVSRPPFLSGTPQGPRVGVVRGGFVSHPFMAVRRFAVVRRQLNECPVEFHDNSLIKEMAEFCPRVCRKRYCIQINEICCIYRDFSDFKHVVATRLVKRR